jgi:ATP-dependent DNA ligase
VPFPISANLACRALSSIRPAGSDWISRNQWVPILARRGASGVRLFTRNGHDWTERFPLMFEALNALLLNAQFEEDGPLVFQHACLLGCEGIVSKRKNSRYRSGRSRDWVKMKNPKAPAVMRELEEDWGKRRWR